MLAKNANIVKVNQNPACAGFLNAVGSGVEPHASKDIKQVSTATPAAGEYLPATYHKDIITGDKKNNNLVSNKDVIFDAFQHVVPTADTYYQYNQL